METFYNAPIRPSGVGAMAWDEASRLSERQHSGARLVRPVERDDSALVELQLAIFEGAEKRGTACFWYERFTAEENNTGRALPRVRKDLREIQVVCQKYVGMSA